MASKDWSKTVADVSESLKLDPDFLDGYGLRAAAYAKLGRLDLAIADASFVIRRKPALVSGYTGRGELYMQQKNYDAAIGDFASVIALMPDSGAGYALRGIAYRAKGDFDHALADSSKMIEINARSPSGYFLSAGWSMNRRAITPTRRAISTMPHSARPQTSTAACILRSRRGNWAASTMPARISRY